MPGKSGNYSKENLLAAIEAVENGMPIATAAKTYNVPRTTIKYKHEGKIPMDTKRGHKTVLNDKEEMVLENWVLEMAKAGFPITKYQLLTSVGQLVKTMERENPFTNGKPGRKWFRLFLNRHPKISQRLTQNLTSTRAAVTESQIRNWFKEIEEYLTTEKITIKSPRQVFNTDETAFFLCPKGKTALAEKGSKSVYNLANSNEKECITTLVTANADGEMAPPMLMFAYERLPKKLIKTVPESWGIGKSENGWMTSESFYEYVANVFQPFLQDKNIPLPVLLFVDGHKSHLTLNISRFCSQNNIVLISLPPNSTHILQPMDVGVFHPLKTRWRDKISEWRLTNFNKNFGKENFAPVLEQVLDETFQDPNICKNSFRKCGLYPFKSDNVDFSKIIQDSVQTDKIFQVVESDNLEDDRKLLEFLENKIPDKMETFLRYYEEEMWLGEPSDESLFHIWKELKNKVEKRHEERSAIEIVIEDGLILPKNWMEEATIENANESRTENKIIKNAVEEIQNHPYDWLDFTEDFNDPGQMEEKETKDSDQREFLDERKIIILENRILQSAVSESPKVELSQESILVEHISNQCVLKQKNKIISSPNSPNKIIEKEENFEKDEYEYLSTLLIEDEKENINRHDIKLTPEKLEMFSSTPEKVVTEEEKMNLTNEDEKENINDIKLTSEEIRIEELNMPASTSENINDTKLTSEELRIEELEMPASTSGKDKNEEIAEEEKIKSSSNNSNQELNKSELVPSPFKNIRFWPGASSSKKKLKKKREKIPSVCSSKKWQEYHEKKEKEKLKIEEEKAERKRKREENKKAKESSNKKKVKREVQTIGLANNDKELEMSSNQLPEVDEITEELKVGDYVIVDFQGDQYPGVIKNKETNKYFVSVMHSASKYHSSKWKWPDHVDELWYEREEIVQKITEPKISNKRGIYDIPELINQSIFEL